MKPVIIGDATLYLGDCVDVMRSMPENSVDSIVTDPPYELGFMGKAWDGSGISYSVGMWVEALRVLKPGGHLLAFSGSRTYHRMTCAIEDAGFGIRDQIMWVYGSGFPKSHNLKGNYDGWGTALKPSHEPICVARKPLIGTVAGNVLRHGTGAFNIDACRVASPGEDLTRECLGHASAAHQGYKRPNHETAEKQVFGSTNGRWPANFIHDGSDEVYRGFDLTSEEKAVALCADCGNKYQSNHAGCAWGWKKQSSQTISSAARFFYCAKASAAERGAGNNHPTVKPVALMRYLVRLVTPSGGLVLDPFTGSGSTARAAILEGFRFIGCDLSADYIKIASERIAMDLSRSHDQVQDSLI